MQLITTVLASFAALLQLAAADFDIYAVAVGRPNNTSGNLIGWSVFPDKPSCDEAWSTQVCFMVPKVTGDTAGVRCQGGTFGSYIGYQGAITELEMNFIGNKNSPSRRFTIRDDDMWKMRGTDGSVVGNCVPLGGGDYQCYRTKGTTGNPYVGYGGARKFRCTGDITAQQLVVTWVRPSPEPFDGASG